MNLQTKKHKEQIQISAKLPVLAYDKVHAVVACPLCSEQANKRVLHWHGSCGGKQFEGDRQPHCRIERTRNAPIVYYRYDLVVTKDTLDCRETPGGVKQCL